MDNKDHSITADEKFKQPCSVDLFLPQRYEQMLKELVDSGQEITRTLAIHTALWQMRGSEMTKEEREAEFIALIEEGLNSGPGIEVTPEYWKAFKRRCYAYSEWLKTQTLGNTTLPDELYQYIQSKISSGQYTNATEVVCAALDKWKKFQSK